jgi:DNA-binding NtrC family response regulator
MGWESYNPETEFVGNSLPVMELRRAVQRLASSEASVLITGDPGTGKETLAHFIHDKSLRAAKPFVPIDCAMLADRSFEKELFGSIGATDGTARPSLGLIRCGDGGTLFLDNVCELGTHMQFKLLRVMEEQAIRPIDGRPTPVNVRVIAATFRDLAAAVHWGTFRRDLYFRLNQASLKTPTLRQRPQDIVPLAEFFLKQWAQIYPTRAKTITPQAAQALRSHTWPGNIPELAALIREADSLASDGVIDVSDILYCLRGKSPGAKNQNVPKEIWPVWPSVASADASGPATGIPTIHRA